MSERFRTIHKKHRTEQPDKQQLVLLRSELMKTRKELRGLDRYIERVDKLNRHAGDLIRLISEIENSPKVPG